MSTYLDAYRVPQTELQAVNVGMAAIGANAITSLANASANSDSAIAIRFLGEVNRTVQSEGWAWNTDDAFPIDPGPDGDITLPANTVKVKQAYASGTYDKNLVERGGRLYDRKNHTFNIGTTAYVDIVTVLDFEDLPQAARNYISLEAASRLVAEKLVSTTASKFVASQLAPARILLEQAEADADQSTMADNPHVQRTRSRRR